MKKNGDKVSIREVYEIVSRLETKIDERLDGLDDKFVTRPEFWPIRTIVYAGAGLVLTGVLGALLALIIK